MARSVPDLALMLSVVAGPSARSPLSISEDPSVFAAPLDADLTGLRVGWSPDLGGSLPVERAVLDTIIPRLRLFEDLGCTVDEVKPDFTGAEYVFRTLRAWQFRATMGDLMAEHPDALKPALQWNIAQGAEVTADHLATALRLQGELFERFADYFSEYDVLVLPVSQVVPFDADLEYPQVVEGIAQETYLDWMRSSYFVSAVGLPAMSIPAGFTPDGLPVGLQIVGPYRSERTLLEVGHAFQSASQPHFVKPDAAVA